MIKKFFVIVILLFFLSTYVPAYAAGVPAVIGYQGRLANAAGNLLGDSGTTYYFKFSIWDVATGGDTATNRLWPSSDPSAVSAVVRQGVFNVNIDVSSYNFNTDEEIYLQVEVSLTSDGIFQTLSPRQRISATPFARMASFVSGSTTPSSFGTTTPFGTSLVSIEATSTQSTGLTIRGFASQLANLFQIQNSAGINLFMIDKSGNVGVGTTTATRKFNILDENDAAQLRLSQSSGVYGEFQVVPTTGDVHLSSTGKNFRMQDENLWVCSGGACEPNALTDGSKGNVVVQTAVIFNNKFKFKLKDNPGATTTTIMIDSLGNEILEFDEDGGP
ncbi:MAG: hypothetical protein AAB837_02810 [Patescibacteria group bacterium]